MATISKPANHTLAASQVICPVLRACSKLLYAADRKELEQFIQHKVLKAALLSDIRSSDKTANLTDCVWIRKWKAKGTVVKSRLCA